MLQTFESEKTEFMNTRVQRAQFYLTELVMEMEIQALPQAYIIDRVKDILQELRPMRNVQ